MNTHYIKVIGKAVIDSELDDTKDYSLCYKRLGVRSINKKPLEENGDYEYTYSLENLDTLTVIGEDKIATGRTKKHSQRLRGALFHHSSETDYEAEDFYDKFINRLCVPENIDKVSSLLGLDK